MKYIFFFYDIKLNVLMIYDVLRMFQRMLSYVLHEPIDRWLEPGNGMRFLVLDTAIERIEFDYGCLLDHIIMSVKISASECLLSEHDPRYLRCSVEEGVKENKNIFLDPS